MFNKSLSLRRIPSEWKMSHITPIYKDGDPAQACNYRLISLLSLLSKILERIVHNEVSSFFHTHSLISDCQFGFHSGSLSHMTGTSNLIKECPLL